MKNRANFITAFIVSYFALYAIILIVVIFIAQSPAMSREPRIEVMNTVK